MASRPPPDDKRIQQQMSRSPVRCDMHKGYTQACGLTIILRGREERTLARVIPMRQCEVRHSAIRIGCAKPTQNVTFRPPATFPALRGSPLRIPLAFSPLAYSRARAALSPPALPAAAALAPPHPGA